jgi:hypothetical protein
MVRQRCDDLTASIINQSGHDSIKINPSFADFQPVALSEITE